MIDEVDASQIRKDAQKPQEISVLPDDEAKEEDIKKDDIKMEQKHEAVETPQSEISDIESKDKDTEKGIFKETEKESEILKVKDITSDFISQERIHETVEAQGIIPESVTVQSDLPITDDEQQKDEGKSTEKKDVITDPFLKDKVEIEDKITSEVSLEELEKDVIKLNEKEISDADSKITTDISSDINVQETKIDDIKQEETSKTIEETKEPDILGDSSALSATYLEIIEKLQQDAQDVEEIVKVSTVSAPKEQLLASEEGIKPGELHTDATETNFQEKHGDTKDEKITDTTELGKEELIEGKEILETADVSEVKVTDETKKLLLAAEADEETVEKETESQPSREVIDLQEQIEISQKSVLSLQNDITSKPEDTDIEIKESISLVLDESTVDKSLSKETIKFEEFPLKDQKDISADKEQIAADDVRELQDSTEFVLTEEPKDIEPISEKLSTDVTDAKPITGEESEVSSIVKADDVLEQYTQDVVDKTFKIPEEIQKDEKEDLTPILNIKDDKQLKEDFVETYSFSSTTTDKGIDQDIKTAPIEQKFPEVSSDIAESIKSDIDDIQQSEQKEISDSTDKTIESLKEPIVPDATATLTQIKETVDSKIEEMKSEEKEQYQPLESVESTGLNESLIKEDKQDNLAKEEMDVMKHDEMDSSGIHFTLPEKELKEDTKSITLPSTIESSKTDTTTIHSVVDSSKEVPPKQESIPEKVAFEISKESDFGVEKEEEIAVQKDLTSLSSQEEQLVSKLEKSEKKFVLSQDTEISDTLSSDSKITEGYIVPEETEKIIEQTETESKGKQIIESLTETEIVEDTKLEKQEQIKISEEEKDEVNLKDEISTKQVEMIGRETDKIEKSQEEKYKTEIIQNEEDETLPPIDETLKEDHKETDDNQISRKDIEVLEDEKPKSPEKQKDNIACLADQTIEVLSKPEIQDVKESVILDSSQTIHTESSEKQKESDQKIIDESIHSTHPEQVTLEQTIKHEESDTDALPQAIDETSKVVEKISKIDDTGKEEDEVNKTENAQKKFTKDEAKTEELLDSKPLDDQKDIDRTEDKTEVSASTKLDFEETKDSDETMVEHSTSTRKESLKTEEKIERDTVVTEKQEPMKEEKSIEPKSDSAHASSMSVCPSHDEKVGFESQDPKKYLESQDVTSEKENLLQKSYYDQTEDDAGDGEPPPSPGDEYVDSGLEEEPIFTKLEAPEHPEYVTVTPDSTPASPKALPSLAKTREEEKDSSLPPQDIDSGAKIDIGKKDVLEDTFIESRQTATLKDSEKFEDTSQKIVKISESSTDVAEQSSEKKDIDASSKSEDFASSTTESESFVIKSVSPPKSPCEVVFSEEINESEMSKSVSDKEQIETKRTYDKSSIAEAKMLDDSIDAEEIVSYTISKQTKEVDEFLKTERKIEETIQDTKKTSVIESSTPLAKITTSEPEPIISDSQKEHKDTKLDESSTKVTSTGETIVPSISDTKISEKADIESSEKEIMKCSMEDNSEMHTTKELELTTLDSSKTTSELATTSETISATKSTEETIEQTKGISTITTILSETKEVKDTEKLGEDSTLSTTVKKMLVTASSEDGGAETVLCATGTIKATETKPLEKVDTSIADEKPTAEKETFSKKKEESTIASEKETKGTEETIQSDFCSEETSGKFSMKPTHPTVTDVKHTNGHLHESDVDIQSTDEEEIVDGKKIIRTKTTKTTTTTKIIKKSVSESTDSEDEHKDSVTEETEIGEDGKIITRKITRTYKTIVKKGDEIAKSPSKTVDIKDSELSKLSLESTEKEGSIKSDELQTGTEPELVSTSSTTTTTTITKILSGSDGEEIVTSTSEKTEENDAFKSTILTTTEKHGDTEVKIFKEVTVPKSDVDVSDDSKVSAEILTKETKSISTSGFEIQSSESVEPTQASSCVETIVKSEITETTSSIAKKSTEETAISVLTVSKDILDAEKEFKVQEDPLHNISGSATGPLTAIKKETVEIIRSATPGSDAMSDRDFDVGGPSTPHSDISSGQVSRAATNIWGSEGQLGSQHYDSDEEEEGPVSPLSVTSQVAPSPPPPHFDFEISEQQKFPEMEAQGKHTTISSFTQEDTKQSSEISKDPHQALTSSMTSSFYGSLPAEPPLSPQSITMKAVDPMSASFIVESEDPEHKGLFSHTEYSTYTYGEYEEEGESTKFEHFSSSSHPDPDDTLDFQQALYEHRAARGEDLTAATTSSTYHFESKLKESPEKIVTHEHPSVSGVNGQRKEHSFKEFTEDYGNGNLAGAKQFEDLMNRNREIEHDLGSKLNGKRADEYSDLSGPASTESYSQEIFTTTKVSTMDPTFIRNGSDEKKTFTTTMTTLTKTISGAEPDTHATQALSGSSTTSQAFPEPPQGFGLPSVSKPETKKDPIEGWGKPLGLPAPAPPPTNNTNAQGDVMAMTNTNKGTPKKEKKVMQMKKSMMIGENNKTTGGQISKDKTKSPESPVKQKAGSNKVGIGSIKTSLAPIYVDLSYVPHHGNSYYTALDFFKKVRARYYVFSGTEPSREVYNALLEAKQTWEDKELEVTIIPTYDTDTLGYWVAENEDALAKCKIDLSPSASRCTINLQDHETSCSAYRLEF